MKKLFAIFFLLQIIPVVAHSDTTSDAGKYQCINKIKKEHMPDSDDLFCFNPSSNSAYWDCFKADSNACIKNTTVCILGSNIDLTKISVVHTNSLDPQTSLTFNTTTSPDRTPDGAYTLDGMLIGYHTCAISYEGSGSDNWYKHYNPKVKIFTECSTQKWKKDETKDKIHEVMIINKKPLLDDTKTKPLEYFVQYYSTPKYPNVCIGYYCKDANGNYQEPGENGSCGNGSGDGSGGGRNAPGQIHRNTVKPYLDALKSACPDIIK